MDIFRFSGDVVAKASDKSSPEDVCPADMKAWIDSIPEDVSEAEIEFASMGGDVFAGIQMANMVKGLSQRGVKVKASVTSIAASIASVVVCACDEIELWDGAFLMVHLPWTCVQGNASDLKKEAAVLDQCKQAMLAFYRTKFNVSDEEIEKMLEAETWIDSVNFGMYGLAAAVSPKEAPKIAASLNSRNFKNLPKGFKMEEETKELIEEKKPEAAQEPEKPAEEPKAEEAPAEEKPAEPALEELKKKLEEKDAEIEELKK